MYLIFEMWKGYNEIKGGKRLAEFNDIYGSIYQNLVDAGCDLQLTDQCMTMIKEEKYFDVLDTLSVYKKSLLWSVHI